MIFLLTLFISILVSIAMVPICRELAIMFYVVEMPNESMIRAKPLPGIGGIAIFCGALLPVLIWNNSESFMPAYLASALLLAMFGLVEDFRGLRPSTKLLGQFIPALITVVYGGIQIRSLGTLLPDGFLLPGAVSIPLTVLVIVGVTNAINLSDGLDGLAGGRASLFSLE